MERNDASNVLEKGIRVLQAFRPGDEPLRLSEIARRTGMAKSTVHRVIGQLLDLRLLSEETGHYELGIVLFELSALVPVKHHLREVALPFMQDLYAATRHTIHLGIRDDVDVVYAEKIHGHTGVDLPSRVGGRLPLNCTAVGKALLAYTDRGWTEAFLCRPMRRLTPSSITDPRELARELAEVRATGLAFEREESRLNTACVAAPVLVRGQAVAALSISVPSADFHVPQLAPALRTTALGLSRRLSETTWPDEVSVQRRKIGA